MAWFIEFFLFGLDELEEPGFADAVVRRFDKKTFDQGREGFGLGLFGRGGFPSHEAPLAGMDFQNALGGQFADGFLDRVGVDPKFLAEGSHRREPVAGEEPLGSDGAFHGMDDLFIDRLAGLELDGKGKHGKERTNAARVFCIAVHGIHTQAENIGVVSAV